MASLPPRRITALPLFKHRAAPSTVTLGRASYTMPMTPIGTLTFSIYRPLGRVWLSSTQPQGSGRSATSWQPWAIPSIRSPFSANRSSSAGDIPFALPASKSSALAAMISVCRARSASAIASSPAFFSSVVRVASTPAACFARIPISLIFSSIAFTCCSLQNRCRWAARPTPYK